MWRPKEGWEKTLEEICGENPHPYDVHYVEAGADAMYLAVREKLGKMAFLLDEE